MEHTSILKRPLRRGMLERAHFVGAAPAVAAIGPILSAATTLAGFFMQKSANEDAERQRQEEIRRAYQVNEKYGNQSRQKVLQNAQQYAPAQRTENLDTGEQRATQNIEKVLAEYRPADVGPKVEGKVSDAFLAAEAQSEADNLTRAHDFARRLGKLMGYSELTTDEAAANARTAGEIAALHGDRTNELGVSQLRLGAVEPDSTGQLIGDLGTFGAALLNRRGTRSPAPFTGGITRAVDAGRLPAGWRLTP